MAIGNMSKKSGEDRTCSSEDTIADRQTHRQTRSSQYSSQPPPLSTHAGRTLHGLCSVCVVQKWLN